jgi:uncharacterized protein YunC (DUF1805 family)
MQTNHLKFELEKTLLVIKEQHGILACAYINPETCNKTGEACAIVSGVSNYDEMMKAKVIALSNKAVEMGVKIGDSGEEALQKFKS